jgi:hypothetical protein
MIVITIIQSFQKNLHFIPSDRFNRKVKTVKMAEVRFHISLHVCVAHDTFPLGLGHLISAYFEGAGDPDTMDRTFVGIPVSRAHFKLSLRYPNHGGAIEEIGDAYWELLLQRIGSIDEHSPCQHLQNHSSLMSFIHRAHTPESASTSFANLRESALWSLRDLAVASAREVPIGGTLRVTVRDGIIAVSHGR